MQSINRDRLAQDKVNSELEGVIESYELAFRMQTAVPKIMDFTDESPSTLDAYGIGGGPTDNFGRQCLMARRFAEAGVRFIELGHGGWDQHSNLRNRLTANCTAIDQPIAALLADLKQRGMLKDTLVVWGGEFGRTPHAQNGDGRDHNAAGYSMWMAGGGVKGGLRYGATDEHGIRGGREQDARPRPARHDPAPPGPRPRAAHLPLLRPRLPPDRRARQRGEGDPGVMPDAHG